VARLLLAAAVAGALLAAGCQGDPFAAAIDHVRAAAPPPAPAPAAGAPEDEGLAGQAILQDEGPPGAPGVPKPPVVQRPIPFGAQRKAEMTAYARRHYGIGTYRLVAPQVIVEHYTETPTADAAYGIFAVDQPDVELHELPGTCAHFIVDTDGTIEQLVPLGIMCRHTVGLNWTAIGIENVGMSDGDVMGNAAERRASLALTRWLRCRYGIRVRNVIGHNESLRSPFHHEKVPSLRTQTHLDMQTPTMDRYRADLAAAGC
jgi:N-acetylmuramoyl-L-alanine amidase